ncbi:hypothetical protein [Leucobacter musarum]|uniref:hypothetical protein n=1 Tax=Leucobacter musarum TaxID=1930747 RepID=UPI0006A7A580|nr:hypothetical protein [Leucobacter musarum]
MSTATFPEFTAAAPDRVALVDARVAGAAASIDAELRITDGPWEGFTRGRAIAWCWNLFQYEPHGFVHPGSEVRVRAWLQLEAGGLPAVFGYPARARELEGNGVTPTSYRELRKALGSRTFSPGDVRRG